MSKTLRSILTVAVTFSLLFSSAYADAISKWAKGEFSLSTLSEKQRVKELQWFQKAAQPFKGMEVNVLSETIPTRNRGLSWSWKIVVVTPTYPPPPITRIFFIREINIYILFILIQLKSDL